MSGGKPVECKVPKSTEDSIPTGWEVKTDAQKDGSKSQVYYCPGTGQHFYTYADLIRYVDYAKSNNLGVYSKSFKSVRRGRHPKIKKTATKSRKTSSILSLPRRSSNPDSLTVADLSSDSESPPCNESSDKEKDKDYMGVSSDQEKDEGNVDISSEEEEKDGDYVPEPDGAAYLEVDDESEMIRNLRASKKPRAHNPALC